jgi:hypothetical protein
MEYEAKRGQNGMILVYISLYELTGQGQEHCDITERINITDGKLHLIHV